MRRPWCRTDSLEPSDSQVIDGVPGISTTPTSLTSRAIIHSANWPTAFCMKSQSTNQTSHSIKLISTITSRTTRGYQTMAALSTIYQAFPLGFSRIDLLPDSNGSICCTSLNPQCERAILSTEPSIRHSQSQVALLCYTLDV